MMFSAGATTVTPPATPIDPADLNFEFTYSTGNADGGSSVLLYSHSSTYETANMSGFATAPMTVTKTETLTASGTFSFGGGFGFNLMDGITVTVQSSGSGTSKSKSTTVYNNGPADVSRPTDWWGTWHYPELREEITVTNSGAFSADVTLTFGLLGGLGVDTTYSANTDLEIKKINRTESVYWETDADGTNTYRQDGISTGTQTFTYHFGGNGTDGFDANSLETYGCVSNVTSVGTRHVGDPPESQPDDWSDPETILDGVQLALDIGGLLPGLGEPLDLINAGISLGRGNIGEASLSLAATWPIGGQAATAAKLAGKAGNAIAKNLDKADEAAGLLVGLGDEFGDAVKQYQNQNQNIPKLEVPLGRCPGDGPHCFTPGHRTIVKGDGDSLVVIDENQREVRWAVGLLVIGGALHWLRSQLAASGPNQRRSKRRRDEWDEILV